MSYYMVHDSITTVEQSVHSKTNCSIIRCQLDDKKTNWIEQNARQTKRSTNRIN